MKSGRMLLHRPLRKLVALLSRAVAVPLSRPAVVLLPLAVAVAKPIAAVDATSVTVAARASWPV